MKKFILSLVIALFAFLLGSAVTLFRFSGMNNTANVEIEHTFSNPSPLQTDTDWKTVLSYENKDLSELTDEQNNKLIRALGNITKIKSNFRGLKLLSKISNADNQNFYVLIEINHLINIPGNCGLRIHLFDADGNYKKLLSFNAGWRIDVEEVRVKYSSEINREIIEVDSKPVINGRNIAKQYYALIDTNILPVRLEDDANSAVSNSYELPNETIGLSITGRSAEDWKKSLKSIDKAEILASLLWLNGKHINSPKEPDYVHEDLKEAAIFREVKSDEEIKVIIENLSKSENRWIKEAAGFREN